MENEEYELTNLPPEIIEETIPLVIQGPTTYCKEVFDYYKNYKQIWSTWNSEPEENLDFLRSQENVHLVLDDLPTFSQQQLSGLTEHAAWTLQRATYQFTSTLNGFNYLEENTEFGFAPKIRSDFLIDIPTAIRKSCLQSFNCLGWHKGSVGYFIDYFFAGNIKMIIELMSGCLNLSHPSHSKNVMTYYLLEKMKKRNISYCFDHTVYTYSLKHKYTTNLFLGEISKGKWLIDENQNHTSQNINYTFTKDNLPDKYPLTYGWGPI